MVADSYYCPYFLIAMMQNRGVDVVDDSGGSAPKRRRSRERDPPRPRRKRKRDFGRRI